MRWAGLLGFGLLTVSYSGLMAKELYVGQTRPAALGASGTGCRSLSDTLRADSLHISDPETSRRFEATHCKWIDGEVYVEDIQKIGRIPFVCVRPKGDPYCYWTNAVRMVDSF